MKKQGIIIRGAGSSITNEKAKNAVHTRVHLQVYEADFHLKNILSCHIDETIY
jgi:hypothetical protein